MRVAGARLTLLIPLLATLEAGAARGDSAAKMPLPAHLSLATATTQSSPPSPYTPPGAAMGEQAPPTRGRSVTEKWWFWAAVGGVIATTVVIILIAGQAPDPPDSVLGDMGAFGKRPPS